MPASTGPAARWLTALAAAAVCASGALSTAAAQPPLGDTARVAVADIGPHERPSPEDRRLREALRAELQRIDGVELTTTRRADWVLRGSLTALERTRAEGGRRVRAKVSLVVAERRGGAIRMMLSGGATARGGRSERALTGDALRAAVRGALRPLARRFGGRSPLALR